MEPFDPAGLHGGSPDRRYTWEEYADLTECSEVALEFDRGIVTPRSHGDLEHHELGQEIHLALHAQLRGTPCRAVHLGPALARDDDAAHPDDARTRIPDVTVLCDGGPRRGAWSGRKVYVATNPTVVVEVLSDAPELRRLDFYRSLPTLREIVVVRKLADIVAGTPGVEVWRRRTTGQWAETSTGYPPHVDVPLEAIGCVLDMRAIRARVAELGVVYEP